MTITVDEVLKALETWAPTNLAESWDNVGLQVGSRQQTVQRLGVALDLTPSVLAQAQDLELDCLVTHHPLFFNPPRVLDLDLPLGALVAGLIQAKISLIAMHTNLDAAQGGVNDALAQTLGLRDIRPLCPQETGEGLGLGRIGTLPEPLSLEGVAQRVAKALGVASLEICGDLKREVRQVALCGGAGGSLIPAAVSQGAEVYLTGECKYHQAREAEALGLALLVAGHFETEVIIVPEIARFLEGYFSRAGKALEIHILNEKSPFQRIFVP